MAKELVIVEQPEYALTREQIERFITDGRWEANHWRHDADKEFAYYDNRQLDSEVLELMRDRGLPPLIRNLIAPAIDAALGIEAKNRRDLRVIADSDDPNEQLAVEAVNAEFIKAQRVADFDGATAEAYKGQICVGVDWVHVTRPIDPFGPKYAVERTHRREIFWDMRAVKYDLSDARYLIRKKWHDTDVLKTVFPKHANLIEQAKNMWAGFDAEIYGGMTTQLQNSYAQFTSTALEAMEWLDTDRERVALYEVWYRRWVRGQVFYIGDTVFEFDAKNPYHEAVVSSGRARLETCPMPKIRLAYWIGPHQVMDIPSPFPHNRFPYIGYFGMFEDSTNIPYGLIRRMMSPQDEVNARLSRMMWALSAKRVIGDTDMFAQSDEEVMDEVARSDAFIKLNPNRTNKDKYPDIKTDHQMARDQFMVMQDATQHIFQSVGSHGPFRGERQPGLDSGVAVQALIEQSATALNDINDNHLRSRKLTGEQLLSLVKQDIGRDPLKVTVQKGDRKVMVVLNSLETDGEGNTYRTNNIAQLRMRMDVEEVPKTLSYRQQQYVQFAEVVKSAPPEIQPLLIDLLVKASDLPVHMRDEAVSRIRAHLGFGQDGDDEGARQAREQAQAEASRLQLETANAELQKTIAEVRKIYAQIEKLGADAGKLQHDASISEDERQMALDKHEKELKVLEEQAKNPQPAGGAGGSKAGSKKAA